MIDHMNLPVSDLESAASFYAAALAPLGLAEVGRDGDAIGYGVDAWRFGIEASGDVGPTLHVAFAAADRAAVDAFHKAALAVGGRDNGAPGERPRYGAGYYAAYALDPDGHNIEAVFRGGTAAPD